jgi:hypothetical protein
LIIMEENEMQRRVEQNRPGIKDQVSEKVRAILGGKKSKVRPEQMQQAKIITLKSLDDRIDSRLKKLQLDTFNLELLPHFNTIGSEESGPDHEQRGLLVAFQNEANRITELALNFARKHKGDNLDELTLTQINKINQQFKKLEIRAISAHEKARMFEAFLDFLQDFTTSEGLKENFGLMAQDAKSLLNFLYEARQLRLPEFRTAIKIMLVLLFGTSGSLALVACDEIASIQPTPARPAETVVPDSTAEEQQPEEVTDPIDTPIATEDIIEAAQEIDIELTSLAENPFIAVPNQSIMYRLNSGGTVPTVEIAQKYEISGIVTFNSIITTPEATSVEFVDNQDDLYGLRVQDVNKAVVGTIGFSLDSNVNPTFEPTPVVEVSAPIEEVIVEPTPDIEEPPIEVPGEVEETPVPEYDSVVEALLGEAEIATFVGHEGEGTLLGNELGPNHELYFDQSFNDRVINGPLGSIEATRPNSSELYQRYFNEIFAIRLRDTNPNITREDVRKSLSGEGPILSYVMPMLNINDNSYVEQNVVLGPELEIISIVNVVPGSEARWINVMLTDGREIQLVLPYMIGSDNYKTGIGMFVDPANPNVIYHVTNLDEAIVELDEEFETFGSNILVTIFLEAANKFGLELEQQAYHVLRAAKNLSYNKLASPERFRPAVESFGEEYEIPARPFAFSSELDAYPLTSN